MLRAKHPEICKRAVGISMYPCHRAHGGASAGSGIRTGAVGGYFGGRLAEAGEDVHFVARGRHLAAMREHGLRISSIAGDLLLQPAQVSDRPSSIGPVDVVLVGVKAWQVEAAAGDLRPLVGEHTMVVPLQNGIEAPGQLTAVLGEHVVGGLCRVLAYVEGPGHIRHAGVEPYIAFGELDGARSERVEALQAGAVLGREA